MIFYCIREESKKNPNVSPFQIGFDPPPAPLKYKIFEEEKCTLFLQLSELKITHPCVKKTYFEASFHFLHTL